MHKFRNNGKRQWMKIHLTKIELDARYEYRTLPQKTVFILAPSSINVRLRARYVHSYAHLVRATCYVVMWMACAVLQRALSECVRVSTRYVFVECVCNIWRIKNVKVSKNCKILALPTDFHPALYLQFASFAHLLDDSFALSLNKRKCLFAICLHKFEYIVILCGAY